MWSVPVQPLSFSVDQSSIQSFSSCKPLIISLTSIITFSGGEILSKKSDLREAELQAEFVLELRWLLGVEDGDGRDRLAWEKQQKNKIKETCNTENPLYFLDGLFQLFIVLSVVLYLQEVFLQHWSEIRFVLHGLV